MTARQGIRIAFVEEARAVFRLSGTGTAGATLRLYVERFDRDRHDRDTAAVLAPVVEAARELAEIVARTGRAEPSIVT